MYVLLTVVEYIFVVQQCGAMIGTAILSWPLHLQHLMHLFKLAQYISLKPFMVLARMQAHMY